MTNKLPVVGKRYKPKNLNLRNFYKFEYETIAVTKKNIAVKIVRSDFKHLLETVKVYDINSIKNKLEELPEDKAETTGAKNAQVEIKPETQSHISELSPEVQVNDVEKAKERLRKAFDTNGYIMDELITQALVNREIRDSAQALLDALDAEKENNEVKAELPKEESKSIWEDVINLLYKSALSPEQIKLFEIIFDEFIDIKGRLTKLESK